MLSSLTTTIEDIESTGRQRDSLTRRRPSNGGITGSSSIMINRNDTHHPASADDECSRKTIIEDASQYRRFPPKPCYNEDPPAKIVEKQPRNSQNPSSLLRRK